ncbi:proline iminopeptidase-family hydrolase [Vagococcus coleopterorum]|uniref:Proline iminopeptidase n=1 Tax=Vagococcus coleopterorum TaxID=2714946 RepID=A0A6G8AL69_9ENTE|nr:proline iminopeptidase-family hydrolase [Vagococcus coleopterorum]QIL45746.1 proline iminopeptidase-family hydrolase [Vagococcus coleopterorum]
MTITEGYMPYLGYQTYYRIVGDTNPQKAPLILLHGGPGSTHNYFELFDELAKADQRQIIMYDQLGCGLSATESRPDLWTSKTWIEELIALKDFLNIDECHILGQSWGGMMLIEYLCDYNPTGIKSAILSSTLPSSELWGQEQHRMIKFMSAEHQAAIAEAEATNNFTSEAYLAANEEFMLRHAAPHWGPDAPEPLRRKKVSGTEAYNTAWGPNEFHPNGNLHNWEYRDKLHTIAVPTLVTSGSNDLSTPLIAKTMADDIPNAKWELFAHSRHMPFAEETEKYIAILTDWLNTVETN